MVRKGKGGKDEREGIFHWDFFQKAQKGHKDKRRNGIK